MEINDLRHIEIFHTLEKIERMNKAIHFHRLVDDQKDEIAIEQYRAVKKQLTEQLATLLQDLDVDLQVAA
ncbi:MAG: hypothetical protein AAF798_00975 [Bacteroidota bacterium]